MHQQMVVVLLIMITAGEVLPSKLPVTYYKETTQDQENDSEICICSSKTLSAICHGNILDIPKLPSYVKNLSIVDSNYGNLTSEDLQNLKGLPLTTISIKKSQIPSVEAGIFSQFRGLVYLEFDDLVNWNESHIWAALQDLNQTEIKTLIITNIRLYAANNSNIKHGHVFEGLQGSNLTSLKLTSNRLKALQAKILSPLSSLHILILQQNPLHNISLAGLQNLKHLEINEITSSYATAINFCDFHLPQLETLVSRDNTYALFEDNFDCLKSLRNLKLLNHYFNFIPANFVSNLPSLQTLIITKTGHGRPDVNPMSFNSSSLRKLVFRAGMSIQVNENTVPHNVFQYCPNLLYLDWSEFDMIYVTDNYLYKLFRPLRALKILVFEKNNPRLFPRHFLSLFPKITNVSLLGNNNADWVHQEIFYNVTTLKNLNLRFCALAVIDKTVIPQYVLDSVRKIDLSKNVFACNCQLQWFMEWFQNNQKKVVGISNKNKYKCDSPPRLNNVPLLEFDIQDLDCFFSKLYLLPILLFLILLITTIIVYRYRWHLRYLIYILRNRRHKLAQTVQREFDAFVIYSDEDRHFVHKDMLSELEANANLKLSVHFRDFLPGVLIFDNIVQNLYRSDKVILVVSKPFMDSEWCHLEMRMAQKMGIRMGQDIFVVIVLDSLKFMGVSNAFVREKLFKRDYLQYSERDSGQKKEEFWRSVIKALRTNGPEDFEESFELDSELTPLLSVNTY